MSLTMRYGNRGTPEKTSVSVFPVTVDDQTASASTYTLFTIDVSRAGFTPVGIVGYLFENATTSGTNRSYVCPFEMHIDGTNAIVGVRNYASTAAKVAITLDVLYV